MLFFEFKHFDVCDVESLLRRYGAVEVPGKLRDLLPGRQGRLRRRELAPVATHRRRTTGASDPIPILDGDFPTAFLDMGWRKIKLAL